MSETLRVPAGVLIVKYPGQSITTSGASASAAMPTDSEGKQPKWIYVQVATAACYFRMTKGASTSVAGDLLLNPNAPGIILAASQFDTLSAIQVAAAGVVNIMVIENF